MAIRVRKRQRSPRLNLYSPPHRSGKSPACVKCGKKGRDMRFGLCDRCAFPGKRKGR